MVSVGGNTAKLRIILNFAFRAAGALAAFFHPGDVRHVSAGGCKKFAAFL